MHLQSIVVYSFPSLGLGAQFLEPGEALLRWLALNYSGNGYPTFFGSHVCPELFHALFHHFLLILVPAINRWCLCLCFSCDSGLLFLLPCCFLGLLGHTFQPFFLFSLLLTSSLDILQLLGCNFLGLGDSLLLFFTTEVSNNLPSVACSSWELDNGFCEKCYFLCAPVLGCEITFCCFLFFLLLFFLF